MSGGEAERARRPAQRRQSDQHRAWPPDRELDHVVEADRQRPERGTDQPGLALGGDRSRRAQGRGRSRPPRCCRPYPAPWRRTRSSASGQRVRISATAEVSLTHRRRRISRSSYSLMPSVPGYTAHPGQHCGSTALANLLAFHGVKISEETAFGLGAGACFYYVTLEEASPTRWFNGRTARLEENFRDLSGAGFGCAPSSPATSGPGGPPGPRSTPAARCSCSPTSTTSTTTATRPISPATRSSSPAMTADQAQLSDTGFEALQNTSLKNLAWRATAATPPTRSSGHMFTSLGRSTRPATSGRPARNRARRRSDARAGLGRVRRPARAQATCSRGRRLAGGR